MRIIYKIFIPVLFILAIIGSIVQTAFSISIRRSLLEDEVSRTIATVRRAAAGLAGRPEELGAALKDDRAARVRIWSDDRIVLWSDDPSQIGMEAANTPLDRAFGGEAFGEVVDASMLERGESGLGTLVRTLVPIDGAPPARVVEVLTPAGTVLAPVKRPLDALPLAVALASVFVFLSLLAINVTVIARPVEKLRDALRSVAEGALDRPVRHSTFDEFGVLAKDFEMMRLALLGSVEALKKQEENYRRIVQSSPVAIAIHKDEKFVFANEAMARLLAAPSPDALMGRSVYDVVHPDFHDIARDRIRNAVKKGEPAALIEEKFVALDGTVVDVEISGVPFVFEGKPAMQLAALDISERKRIEERAKELDELKSSFVHVVSHQLRTPLSTIRWNLETILAGALGPLKKSQKEFLRVTYDADIEVIRRVQDLLVALDIEEGRSLLTKEAVAVNEILDVLVEKWRRTCDARGVNLVYRKPKAAVPAEVDPAKIKDAFEKLIENAASYTPAGGTVTVDLDARGGKVRFECTDTGIGIPGPERKRLFTRFYRASNAAVMKQDAQGLGLYIAKNFITRHGGTIGFESEEGRGSTFWIEFPSGAS